MQTGDLELKPKQWKQINLCCTRKVATDEDEFEHAGAEIAKTMIGTAG